MGGGEGCGEVSVKKCGETCQVSVREKCRVSVEGMGRDEGDV